MSGPSPRSRSAGSPPMSALARADGLPHHCHHAARRSPLSRLAVSDTTKSLSAAGVLNVSSEVIGPLSPAGRSMD